MKIPEDIMKIAESITRDIPRAPKSSRPFIANIIAYAILAERQRCADLVTGYLYKDEEKEDRDSLMELIMHGAK